MMDEVVVSERCIGRTRVGDYVVSTVFLGPLPDLSRKGDEKPQFPMFETMLIESPPEHPPFSDDLRAFAKETLGTPYLPQEQRYSSHDEALAGHIAYVKVLERFTGKSGEDIPFPSRSDE